LLIRIDKTCLIASTSRNLFPRRGPDHGAADDLPALRAGRRTRSARGAERVHRSTHRDREVLHRLRGRSELAREPAEGGEPRGSDVDTILARSFYLLFAGPLPAQVLRESVRKRVRTYLSQYGDELHRTIRPEVAFEVPLGHARVQGRIDLMLRANAGDRRVELINSKTSENRPPSEIRINQLRLYAAASERPGLEPVKLAIHDLETDERPPARVRKRRPQARRIRTPALGVRRRDPLRRLSAGRRSINLSRLRFPALLPVCTGRG